MILTIPRTQLAALPVSGCWVATDLDFLLNPVWQPRAAVEHDERFLQPIPYLMLRDADGRAWSYQRTGGDKRLEGSCSCGVGGHVDDTDTPEGESFDAEDSLHRALLRELAEELNGTAADLQNLRLRGLIYEGESTVGRVHIGVLYTAQWRNAKPPQPHPHEPLQDLGFIDLADIASDTRFELWSRLAAQYLMDAAA